MTIHVRDGAGRGELDSCERVVRGLMMLIPALLLGCAAEEVAYQDPGAAPWVPVARDALVETCGLDPEVLDSIDATVGHSYAIVRHGRLCHAFYHPDDPGPGETAPNFSATKTLSAALIGRLVRMSRDAPRPLLDTDLVQDWVGGVSFNPEATVAHVLAMVGFNESLAYGEKRYVYDGDGTREINRLRDVVEAVLAQDPALFGGATTVNEFAQAEIFGPLGMTTSEWELRSFGTGWGSSMLDMARLGVLLAHDGYYGGRQLIDPEWVYKISHPAFEDSNTGYGYLTVVAAETAYYIPGFDIRWAAPLGQCDPPALWRDYPHGLSQSPDCGYGTPEACEQRHDVGSFAAVGARGQLIVVHRGLDLVLVTRNAGSAGYLNTPWDLIRPALVAADPVYQGDEDAFCEAYRAGEYAPDLVRPPRAP